MHKNSGKNCSGYLLKKVKYQVCRDKYLSNISDTKLLEHFKCLSLKTSFFDQATEYSYIMKLWKRIGMLK